jgi:hypothetical protein
MRLIPAFSFGENIIKSSGFAVFVMFAMMAAMAYTLWNQYNHTNERVTKLEQQVMECYQRASLEQTKLIQQNTLVMEEVLKMLKDKN